MTIAIKNDCNSNRLEIFMSTALDVLSPYSPQRLTDSYIYSDFVQREAFSVNPGGTMF